MKEFFSTLVCVCVCVVTLSEVLASSNIDFYKPEQIHLSLGENVSAIVVTWSTKNYTEPLVQYGIGPKNLTLTAKGNSFKFVDQGELKSFQFIHRVTLPNLQQKSQYMYRCGSDRGWSQHFQFHTVPAATSWAPRLAVYGDLGLQNAESLPLLKQDVAEGRFDVILHVGDFAYNFETDNGRLGDEFMMMMEPIAASVPYMVAVGNHEAGQNFNHYKSRFSMPRTKDNMFYSFDLGPAHFIGFSSEVYYPDGQTSNNDYSPELCLAQYRWLEKDLKEATKKGNRDKHPWIITFGHKPMYCSTNDTDDCGNADTRIRNVGFTFKGNVTCLGLEDMFYNYGVDLELWAHEHVYERLWPLYNKIVYNGSLEQPYTNPRAPVHITSGSAGCSEYVDHFKPNLKEWSAFRSRDYGYTRMQIYNSTHLHLEQVSVNKSGAVIDEVWLIKETHKSYKPDIDQNYRAEDL